MRYIENLNSFWCKKAVKAGKMFLVLLLLLASCMVCAASFSEVAILTASDASAFDSFGISVSVDGNTIVVGAYGDDVHSGSAYVFASLVTVVDIDIMPGSDSNSINNNGHGVIPVAIL